MKKKKSGLREHRLKNSKRLVLSFVVLIFGIIILWAVYQLIGFQRPEFIIYGGGSNAVLSPDGHYFAKLIRRDGEIVLKEFDIETQEIIITQFNYSSGRDDFDYHPSGESIGILDGDTFVQIDLNNLSQDEYHLPIEETRYMSFQYHPTKPIIAVALTGNIIVYDLEQSAILYELSLPANWATPAIAFSPIGNYFAYSYSYLDTIEEERQIFFGFIIFDMNTGETLINRDDFGMGQVSPTGAYKDYNIISWHPSGQKIAIGSRIFDIRTQEITYLEDYASGGFVFSSDGRYLYTMTGFEYGHLFIWDGSTGRKLREFRDDWTRKDIRAHYIVDYQSPYLLTYFHEEHSNGSGLEIWRVD